MPNVYVPQLIQVRTQYTTGAAGETDNPVNVMWFTGSGGSAFPLTLASLQAIAAVVDTNWSNVWLQAAASSKQYTGSTITDFGSSTGLQYTSVGVFTPVSGAAATEAPWNTSVLISMNSVYVPRYKGGHPRIYLPYLSANSAVMLNGYQITATTQSTINGKLQTFWNAMSAISSTNGGPYLPQVFRHRTNATTAAVYHITSATVNQRLATQRRRLRKAPHH